MEDNEVLAPWIVCPACGSALDASLRCSGPTPHQFAWDDGIPDLVVGARFEDSGSDCRDSVEEEMDDFTIRSYLLPRLAARQHDIDRPLRVLSLGCGVGWDVDLINDAGFDGVGVDCGSRVRAWRTRKHRDKLLQASGLHLPFADGTFDVVFSGCVLAHVGVVGDSCEVTPTYRADRERFCAEAARVTRTGGQLILSGPNRWCPADLFHRQRGYRPRLHLPSEPFLASFDDIRRLFVRLPGVRSVSTLPVTGYWRFNGLRQRPFGSLLAALLNCHFRVISLPAWPFLRRTLLNPWLIVRISK
ncbi:MAG: class I SAM-dependent methyltransferase [Acidobacteria bacterium]|nr:class I SAM-dependent methyltransferase [Acidobacteriota bacterium]